MRSNLSLSGEVRRLQDEMDRLFGARPSSGAFQPRGYPPMNVWEDDENLYVESEIPGMEIDEFELFVNDDNQLTIQGERKRPSDGSATRHRQERSFGPFSRIIQLPVTVDGGSATADYTSGVLTVTMPKKEESKPKRITVSKG